MADPFVQQPNYPEFLEELAAKVAALLVDRGFDPALARGVANDCAEYVRLDWGGQRVYIPMGRVFDLSRRDREIAAMWNGSNTRDVCRKYNISETHLRRIAEAARANSKNGKDDEPGTR